MVAADGAGPSVLGHVLLARGAGAADWVRSLVDYRALEPDGEIQVAVRGAALHGQRADGARWFAVADLVAGSLDDEHGPAWRGRYAHLTSNAGGRVCAVTDPFGTLPLYSCVRDDAYVIGTDLRVVARAPWCRREIDLAAVYDFLNFACIPAPKTIFAEVRRLPPGSRLTFPGSIAHRWYVPEYPEDLRGSDDDLAQQLREQITRTVLEYGPQRSTRWGCFLSGGTDSSSVVTLLARERGSVRTFSIGFAEAAFDELEYARLAARACGADASSAKVSRLEAQALLPRVIEDYDQPFGNASAIPTLACAELAKSNDVDMLLAGDGGDEIFGGNERYAKDRVMETWFAMPAALKAAGLSAGSVVGKSSSHFLNRVQNFFERASLPNPERFYTDDSFASDLYDDLLTPDLRAHVARDSSLDVMRAIYRLGTTGGPLHRVMRLDLLMAIAQNDIPKVHGAGRSAGVNVRFPLLDPELVAFTCRLEERQKVRRLEKRYLFKRAMEPILPTETLRKKKQGFGVPIGTWLRNDAAFRDLVKDTLLGGRAATRGWFRRSCIERLFAEHERGTWDYADPLYRLFVLELWLRRHADAT